MPKRTKYKVHSAFKPALSAVLGKKFIVPTWQQVPMDTTLEDLVWVQTWEPSVNFSGISKRGRKPLADPVTVRKIEVPSSKAGKTYTVTVVGTRVSCDCNGYAYRHTCRHSKEVSASLTRP